VKRTMSLAVWTIAVAAATAAFVVHISIRLETVELGYRIGEARRVHTALAERRRVLTIEAATLRAPQRIERIAKGALGMSAPGHDRIRRVGGAVARRATSGRIQ